MASAAPDFYHQKTDAELLFIVQNPALYHEDLADAARRELSRRGVASARPAPPAETAAYAGPEPDEAPPARRGLQAVVLAGVLLLGGGGYYYLAQQRAATEQQLAAEKAEKLRKNPPKLVAATTDALPSYAAEVKQCVDDQVKRLPAAEKQAEQELRQYRELARRFWTAETQSEYVEQQALAGKNSEAFIGQVELVQSAWEQWNKAQMYSYKFGPKMADDVDIMARVARQQQERLSDLPALLAAQREIDTEANRRRRTDVQDLLSGLRATSPVTGKAYQAQVRHIKM